MAGAVAQLRDEAGITNEELWQRAKMSRSYYYERMGLRAAFDANDFDLLASALGTHPHEISRVAATFADASVDPTLRVDRRELAARVKRLLDSPLPSGELFSEAVFFASLADRGLSDSAHDWAEFVDSTSDGPVRLRVVEALSDYYDVPLAYLTSFDDESAIDATEARLDFRQALRESGADAIAARAVGDVSPAALRAIAKSIRAIGSG
ncbi:helix-turn-helix domain-containing protein [Microbacterium sp. NPDC089698]|uniref:helix-turn-helix domain-containing protein n=1 Tax=Microbacterium sp. NPDC089698 TaxID=3364200 RepID=UPI00381600A4